MLFFDKIPQLPPLLSDGIRLSVEDLTKTENSSSYSINMNVWHEPNLDKSVCEVCLAGSVMAQTFQINPEYNLSPTELAVHFKKPVSGIRNKLVALDFVRTNTIRSALIEYMPDRAEEIYKIPGSLIAQAPFVPAYGQDSELFKTQLLALADWLELQGF